MYHIFLGNGYITTSTLKEILKELDDKITSEELDMMIAEIDADGSGTVDFDGTYNFRKLRSFYNDKYFLNLSQIHYSI